MNLLMRSLYSILFPLVPHSSALTVMSGSLSLLKAPHRTKTTRLHDISEWRDLLFEVPHQLQEKVLEDYQEGPLRQVCILPFPLEDTLLIGETKELCLYEERFHNLFEKSIEEHGSMVAMGMLAPPAGILQTIALCEIESYRVMEGNNGFTNKSILATIRVVGRGCLIALDEDEERSDYLKGWITELYDDTSSEKRTADSNAFKMANELARKLEIDLEAIIRLESKVSDMEYMDPNSKEGISDTAMKIRALEAEIDAIDDEESNETEEDDDDEINDIDSRRSKFLESYRDAFAADCQGYKFCSLQNDASQRSFKELTAISWAYFCSELNNSDILSYRLRALEITNLCQRLSLARSMMKELRSELRDILKSNDSSSDD